MERFGASFLIAGVVTFLLGFFLQGVMPVLTLSKIPTRSVEEMAQAITPQFEQLALDYPDEFQRHFGTVSSESFAKALRLGRDTYVAEACWHCHSQFVRPVSKEDLAFRTGVDAGRVPEPDEPPAPVRYPPGRSGSHSRARPLLERLARGALVQPAQRRAVLGDAVVSVVL